MPTFVGAGFALESVTPTGLATLRVKFTQDPRKTDPTSPVDGTNPSNYAISGPAFNYVTSVVPVSDDTESVDVFLVAALAVGQWTLTVSSIQADTGEDLSSPTSLSFNVVLTPSQTPVTGGAVNDSVFNVLRRFLNPTLKGPAWDSTLKALAAGDEINWNNAKLALDQLYLSTASGPYLVKRAGDQGIQKPVDVEMSDDLFRQLALIQKNKKLTQESLLEILGVFYGQDAVRASIDSEVVEPFPLEDGDDLQILFDGKDTLLVTFQQDQFARIGEATCDEVVAAITRDLHLTGSQAYAATVTDPITNEKVVRVYSGRLGISSSVQIIGGRGQTKLRFPTSLYTETGVSPFAIWDMDTSPITPGNIRFVLLSGIYDLNLLQAGDLVYIYGCGAVTVGNTRGVFEVQTVSVSYDVLGNKVQWFEITNPAGTPALAVEQTLFTDIMFFRPLRRTVYDAPRHVVVAQTESVVDIVVDATTEAVKRAPGQAAYAQEADSMTASLIRVGTTVTATSTAHGLQVGDRVIVDGAVSTGARPVVTPGTPSPDFSSNIATGTTDLSIASDASAAGTFEGGYHKVVRTAEGFLMTIGGSDNGSPITHPVLFEVLGETDVGGRQQTYKWTNLTTITFTTKPVDVGVSVLSDGRILATGGASDATSGASETNAWDLITYTRSPPVTSKTSGTMPTAFADHGQTTLGDGRVLVSGGWAGTFATPVNNAYTFSPTALTWTSRAAMVQTRKTFKLTTLANGNAIAIGGLTAAGAALNTCEIYDQVGNTWSATGPMTYARYAYGRITLPDGRIVVAGGYGYNPTQSATPVILNTCEIYDPQTGFWQMLPPMTVAREYPSLHYIASRNAVVVTGGLGDTAIESLYLPTMKWSVSAAALTSGFGRSAAGVAGIDTILVSGGVNNGGTSTKSNFVVLMGEETFRSGGFNREVGVTSVPTANTFTFETDTSGYSVVSAATITPVAAPSAPEGVPGPFSFDVKEGLAATDVESSVVGELVEGQRYQTLTLSDASEFPDAVGYLAFNFGYDGVVGPVKYLGKLSSTQLILDAGFKFTNTVQAGSTVTLLSGRAPFVPPAADNAGAFYLTGSAAGRIAALSIIADTVAAGVQVSETINYPGDRGLGNEGKPASGSAKLSDAVYVWGGDRPDSEIDTARSE